MDKLTIPKRLAGLEVVAILRQILGVFVVDNNTSTLLGKRHGLGSPKAKGAAVAFVLGCLCFELKPASASLHGTFNIQIAACPKLCCSVKVY